VAWQTPSTGVTGNTGVIWVDDIHLPGFTVPTGTIAADATLKSHNQGLSAAIDHAKSITLRYELASTGTVEVALFDISGKLVTRLFSGAKNAGSIVQTLRVPENESIHGTYLVEVKTGNGSMSGKVVIAR
jgi:hypothetical protein